MIKESVSFLSEIAILVQILSETAPNIFSAFEANLCTQIKFDFLTRTWMDKTAFVTNGWFQTLFLQILKSLNPKISTKVSDSPSKII